MIFFFSGREKKKTNEKLYFDLYHVLVGEKKIVATHLSEKDSVFFLLDLGSGRKEKQASPTYFFQKSAKKQYVTPDIKNCVLLLVYYRNFYFGKNQGNF